MLKNKGTLPKSWETNEEDKRERKKKIRPKLIETLTTEKQHKQSEKNKNF